LKNVKRRERKSKSRKKKINIEELVLGKPRRPVPYIRGPKRRRTRRKTRRQVRRDILLSE